MKKRLSIIACFTILVAAFSGCTSTVGYNPTYIQGEPLRLGISGKSLVVMSDADAQWVYSGSPTSFTGGGSTLQVPMGEITKQVALRVFGAAFQGGADFRSAAGDSQGYRLIVQPKVASLSYAFNQLKNLGFAITPSITMDLRVQLIGADGQTLLDKTYSSGPTEGASYMLSGSPAEKINQLVHQTLSKLMNNAAEDARMALSR